MTTAPDDRTRARVIVETFERPEAPQRLERDCCSVSRDIVIRLNVSVLFIEIPVSTADAVD
ncbi:hypothetical protein [Thiocapsa sp.]|uniref:hypothetical protein n=1 Tax=Thiocapsa sp. TaxID=2024551 RepID=UPI00263637B8|nr:hypothetical protein [Thiocapsa sp.]